MIELVDRAERHAIEHDLDRTLFVEAGAGSGKTRSLVNRVVSLVRAGTPLRRIAAITFTEKAAAELRDRIRLRLERLLAQEPGNDLLATALEELDGAAISTLHAFAQRLLTQHPIEAQLPPRIRVLDEVSSQVRFEERWRIFRGRLLDDARTAAAIRIAESLGIDLETHVRDIAELFSDNWDLVIDESRTPWSTDAPDMPAVRPLLEAIDAALVPQSKDPEDKLALQQVELRELAARLRAAPPERALQVALEARTPAGINGKKQNWSDPPVEEVRALVKQPRLLADALREDVQVALLNFLAVHLRTFTLDAAHERQQAGELEFHDLLVLARRLLREEGREVRAALGRRYDRLLLDEFQDTDPIQIESATLLALADPGQPADGWETAETTDGRLFFVGDPKQSIYRFRRADIGLFLAARDRFGGEDTVSLTTNFRSSPALLAWVNHVFGQLITEKPGAQPDYQALVPAPTRTNATVGPGVALMGIEAIEANMPEVREREAAAVVDAIATARHEGWMVADRDEDGNESWRPCRLGDIAILLPARTSLPWLEDALTGAGIPYRAEASSLVYSTREVRDLLLTARALADPSDQLALLSALRSPLFACGDDDLTRWKRQYRGSISLLGKLPADAPEDDPVRAGISWLRDLHDEVPFLSAAQVLDRLVRGRRVLEVATATRRPRDVWRRIRFVQDQARAWDESENGTLRDYVRWARLQASEAARVSETVLPERDDDAVRILTIHASKGLEFPIVMLSGLGTRPGGNTGGVRVAFPPGDTVAIKVRKDVRNPAFDSFEPIDEAMSHEERIRLLYVAATRARDHLVVSLHRKAHVTKDGVDTRRPHQKSSADLLVEASEGAGHVPLAATGVALPAPAPAPTPALDTDVRAWRARWRGTLEAASRPEGISASAVAELPDPEQDDGLAKQARDLDLPPWLRGRYGSAVGRAVHAVLQTVPLAGASDEEIRGSVAAQAVAEGVTDLRDDIERRVRRALASAPVQAAAEARHWRETYVATSIEGIVLEGYVDLVYEEPDSGLVIIDHKTASSGDDLAGRAERYVLQQAAYARALEASTGRTVNRAILLFLTPDAAIPFELEGLRDAMDSVERRMQPVAD